jgi:hypothetical protein
MKKEIQVNLYSLGIGRDEKSAATYKKFLKETIWLMLKVARAFAN